MDHLAADHHLLQDPAEFKQFCKLLKKEKVKSYLEIGSWSGGSLEEVAKYLPKGSRLVSIEYPTNVDKFMELQRVMKVLSEDGYWTYICADRSDSPMSIRLAEALGPYDALFIDGDHTYAGVKSDWDNYSKMARIVGFHDIAPSGVPRFWDELKGNYKHKEFISDETRSQSEGYGVGVIWNSL